MEIWKEIDGFNEYSVSRSGAIRKGNLIMRSFDNGLGYLGIRLRKDGRRFRFYVHRLVMNAFCPNSDPRLEINHIDHNKRNNCVENLEWVTHRENLRKAVSVLGKEAFGKHDTTLRNDF